MPPTTSWCGATRGPRRRHPLASRGVEESIADERKLLEPVRERADLLIDTGDLNSNQLRIRILEAFGDEEAPRMQTSVISFGYKHGIPLDVDVVFDCRFLPNPFWVEELRPYSGEDQPVRDYVLGQPESLDFLDKVDDLLTSILPAFNREGKSYLTIAMGCTGGRHRSVTLARELATRLERARRAGVGLSPGHRPVSDGRAEWQRTARRRPSVVAIGGGHGTAVTLKAARRYAGLITGVVSVADDGGSSGRLRELLNVVALGDIRKCLVALADEDSALATAFERRYDEGELAGHALGNLILAGLIDATGDLVAGVAEAAHLLGASGDVLPATSELVVLKAESSHGTVAGQVAVKGTSGIEQVSLVPGDAQPPALAVERILQADQVVIGPGSLFTSVLAAVAVGGIAEAVDSTKAQVVYVCNLRGEVCETEGFDVADHVAALARHNVTVDVVLCDSIRGVGIGETGAPVHVAPLTGENTLVHSPAKLAQALSGLLA